MANFDRSCTLARPEHGRYAAGMDKTWRRRDVTLVLHTRPTVVLDATIETASTADARDQAAATWLAVDPAWQSWGRRTASLLRTVRASIPKRLIRWVTRHGLRALRIADRATQASANARFQPSDFEYMLRRHGCQAINRMVPFVPAPYREVVRLCLQGYGPITICGILDLPYTTVQLKSARGKQHLRELLEESADQRALSPIVKLVPRYAPKLWQARYMVKHPSLLPSQGRGRTR